VHSRIFRIYRSIVKKLIELKPDSLSPRFLRRSMKETVKASRSNAFFFRLRVLNFILSLKAQKTEKETMSQQRAHFDRAWTGVSNARGRVDVQGRPYFTRFLRYALPSRSEENDFGAELRVTLTEDFDEVRDFMNQTPNSAFAVDVTRSAGRAALSTLGLCCGSHVLIVCLENMGQLPLQLARAINDPETTKTCFGDDFHTRELVTALERRYSALDPKGFETLRAIRASEALARCPVQEDQTLPRSASLDVDARRSTASEADARNSESVLVSDAGLPEFASIRAYAMRLFRDAFAVNAAGEHATERLDLGDPCDCAVAYRCSVCLQSVPSEAVEAHMKDVRHALKMAESMADVARLTFS